MSLKRLHWFVLTVALCLAMVMDIQAATVETDIGAARLEYAKAKLAEGAKQAELKIVPELGHPEAFRIRTAEGKNIVEGGSSAGVLYGVQALLAGDYQPDKVDKPDFGIRGSTLCLMSGGGSYVSTVSPGIFP